MFLITERFLEEVNVDRKVYAHLAGSKTEVHPNSATVLHINLYREEHRGLSTNEDRHLAEARNYKVRYNQVIKKKNTTPLCDPHKIENAFHRISSHRFIRSYM